MAATNVRFTEYVNVFLPSSKVSADVAHRTFAGAQPAASLSRPQPSESEPDTARQPGASDSGQSSRNSRRKLSCAPSPGPGSGSDKLHQPAEESAAPAETTEPPSGSGRKVCTGPGRKSRKSHKFAHCLP